MPVELHPEAAVDLTRSGDWYEAQRKGLALEFLESVHGAFAEILANPRAGTPWEGVSARKDIRRCSVRRFPFVVIYRIDGDDVMVLAVAHHRRRPGYWLRRLHGR